MDWLPIDQAPKDKGYQWIGRDGDLPFADFMRWNGERWVFSDGSYLDDRKPLGKLFYHPLPLPPARITREKDHG